MMKHEDKTMISYLTKMIFLSCLLINFKFVYAYQELDRIVAIVNKEPITELDLKKGIDKALLFFEQNQIDPPNEKVIYEKVLDELIEKKLIESYASDYNIRVTPEEMNQIINEIALKNNLKPEEFEKEILSQGVSFEEFKSNLKFEVLLKKVKTREISSKLNISEHEIKLHKDKLAKITPDIYDLSHILIKFNQDPSADEKKKKRELAYELIKKLKNEDFAAVAYEYSDAPDASDGGSLGNLKKSQLPEIFVDQIAKLNEGDISDPFESNNGIHILKINGIETLSRKNKEQLATKYLVRQIVLKSNEINSETDVIKKLEKFKSDIENGMDFGNYAEKYSEDFSATNGGTIGWIKIGEYLDFDYHIASLGVNEISEPFQTNNGWHIIQYTEIKTEDISNDSINNQIRLDLINERTEMFYQDWFSSLKAEAFIEIRIVE
jgi:peptidyl-prolyl cis-trans isomerase SurA